MPKTNLQTSILKEKRRVLIMEKALKLFATYGVDNITIDDIADSLKISHGLFYHYFKNKNDLIDEIIKKSKDVFSILLSQLNSEDKSPKEIVRFLSEFILNELKEDEENAYYINFFLTINFQKTYRSNDTGHLEIENLLNIIKKGQKEGEFKDNVEPWEILTIFFTSLEGLTNGKIKYKNEYKLPSSQALLNIFLK